MNPKNPLQTFCEQISKIHSMERGKLSIIREGPTGPFYKLQAHENGKNRTRYVPREEVPAVQEAIDGFKKFQALTQEYAHQVITQTRAAIAAGSKKKKPALNSCSPRTRKSNR
jgi:uncharacterized protein DUF6788